MQSLLLRELQHDFIFIFLFNSECVLTQKKYNINYKNELTELFYCIIICKTKKNIS